MNSENNKEKDKVHELVEEVLSATYIKTVECSFYSTDYYLASSFYKPIANC